MADYGPSISIPTGTNPSQIPQAPGNDDPWASLPVPKAQPQAQDPWASIPPQQTPQPQNPIGQDPTKVPVGPAGDRQLMMGLAQTMPSNVAGSPEDLAKVHMGSNLIDQQRILESIHPGQSKIEGNQLMLKGEDGDYHNFDGASLNVVKDLAQMSGAGVEGVTQALTTLGMTTVGAAAGSGVAPGPGTAAGAAAGYTASLPTGAALGKIGRAYLMNEWTGVKPDSAKLLSDIKTGAALNTVFGLAIPGIGMLANAGKSAAENTAMNQAIGQDSIRKGVQDIIETSTGRDLSRVNPGDFPSKQDIANGAKTFVDTNYAKLGAAVGKYKTEAISNSNDAPVDVTSLKQGILGFLKKDANGSFKINMNGTIDSPKQIATEIPYAHPMGEDGNPVPVTSPAAYNPSIASAPFGSAKYGQKVKDQLIDLYNTLHITGSSPDGMPLSQFDRQVQTLQDLSIFDKENIAEPNINRMFENLQNTARLQRNQEIASRVGPDSKQAVDGAFNAFHEASGPTQAFRGLWDQNGGNAEAVTNALVRPDSASKLAGLANMAGHDSQIMNDIKASYLNDSFNNSMDSIGRFNAKTFMDKVDSMGEINKSTLFNDSEYNQLKAYSNLFQRIQMSKPTGDSVTKVLAKAVLNTNPMTQASRLNQISGQALASVKAVTANPALAEQLAENGFGDATRDLSVPDQAYLNGWLRNLKLSLAVKQQSASMTSQAVKNMVNTNRYNR